MGFSRCAWAVSLGACVFLLGACSLLLDPNRPQCETAEDCPVPTRFACRDGACIQEVGEWSCLDEPATAASRAPSYQLRVTNGANDAPVSGAQARLCPALTPLCADGPTLTTGDAGELEVRGDAELEQVVRISLEEFQPTIIRLLPEIRAPYEVDVTFFPSEVAVVVDRRLGLTDAQHRSTSSVTVRSMDCPGTFGGGAQIEVPGAPEDAVRYYADGRTLSAEAESTFDEGTAGFAGLPDGAYRVRTRVAATGAVIGDASFGAPPGHDIAVYFAPGLR